MNSPAISRCLEKKKWYPTMEDFFKWVYTYIDTSKIRVSIMTVMYFQLHVIPDFFLKLKIDSMLIIKNIRKLPKVDSHKM